MNQKPSKPNTFVTSNCSVKLSVKIQHFSTKQSILLVAAVILLFPALLINLGLVAFYDDEAIRALVALEMQISGNYITPTMFGELYYNKPPLYNWILLAVFELTGHNEEIITRLVTVFFLIVYAGSVYYLFGRNFGLENSSPQPSRSEFGTGSPKGRPNPVKTISPKMSLKKEKQLLTPAILKLMNGLVSPFGEPVPNSLRRAGGRKKCR